MKHKENNIFVQIVRKAILLYILSINKLAVKSIV